ncbi:MAG: hypothetical protein AAGI44_14320 [Pseudomonadota bacterium]
MSKIIWSSLLVPDDSTPTSSESQPEYRSVIDNMRRIPIEDRDITIPDPKALRSMSRASVFLSHVCAKGQEVYSPYLAESPYSIGIYSAVENGPVDPVSTVKIVNRDSSLSLSKAYLKYTKPKAYLKRLANLAPAQMGISLGLRGPLQVYTHDKMGSLQALEQAEWDLKTGAVKAALVCTAHAFDDHLTLKRTRYDDDRTISEGAAAVLLEPDGRFTPWREIVPRHDEIFYGISDQLIRLLENMQHDGQ